MALLKICLCCRYINWEPKEPETHHVLSLHLQPNMMRLLVAPHHCLVLAYVQIVFLICEHVQHALFLKLAEKRQFYQKLLTKFRTKVINDPSVCLIMFLEHSFVTKP
jgi:hypothetical protein